MNLWEIDMERQRIKANVRKREAHHRRRTEMKRNLSAESYQSEDLLAMLDDFEEDYEGEMLDQSTGLAIRYTSNTGGRPYGRPTLRASPKWICGLYFE